MFKDKLRQAMADLGLNQTQLSSLTGIGKSSISRYCYAPQDGVRLGREKERAERIHHRVLGGRAMNAYDLRRGSLVTLYIPDRKNND